MITFFTIVLDGEPWIERHLAVFTRLTTPWRWIIVEGAADNVGCTRWCARPEPRLSLDGTAAYLDALDRDHPLTVTVLRRPLWPGKAAMCNAALGRIDRPCLLWQVDADELWTASQIEAVQYLFAAHPDRNCADFWCRYFVAPNVVVRYPDDWANNPAYEWRRVWRFTPGQRFRTHEPPVLDGVEPHSIAHAETAAAGAVFDHMAYATRAQVEFKQRYYAGDANPNGRHYRDLVDGWERLCGNNRWPVSLHDYFPFVPVTTIAHHL